jgi:diguanylate cyclase (GGDEF)-like protein/PAS domain S-box-containing protein
MSSSKWQAREALKKDLLSMPVDKDEVAQQEVFDAGEKIHMLISGNIVPGLIAFALMWNNAPTSLLITLLGLLGVSMILKMLLAKHYRGVTAETVAKFRRYFILLALYTGSVWGIGTVYMQVYLPPEYHEMMGFIIGALTAGTLVTSSVLRWNYFAFVFPVFSIQAFYLLAAHETNTPHMLLMLLIFFILLMAASESYRKLHRAKDTMTILALHSLDDLRRSEQHLKEITTSMGEGVFVIDENDELTFINPEGERLLGWSFSELSGKKYNQNRTFQNSATPEKSKVIEALQKGIKTHSEDEQFRRKDGQLISVSLTVAPLQTENGEKRGSVTIFEDITTRKNLQKKMAEMALRDALTGLYNRRSFDDNLSNEIDRFKRYGRVFSLLMLDIDHFKKVNDTYGHQTGDDVLKEVAKQIVSAIRKNDYAARYGGEEFTVVLPETDRTAAVELAERIRKAVETAAIGIPDGQTIHCTVSIGVAAVDAGKDALLLVKEADAQLYKAKAQGRNRVV